MKAYWSPSLVLLFLNIGIFCSIGQGIRIESAYYGAPNGVGVDVTRRVQRFADYGEPFRVGNDTLRIDPSPNQPKALVVIYVVDGRRISECVREGDVFYFRSGGESSDSNLDRQLARDHQPFTVSNETFRVDPYQGQQKRLKISYLRGNMQRNQQYEEGDQVQFR